MKVTPSRYRDTRTSVMPHTILYCSVESFGNCFDNLAFLDDPEFQSSGKYGAMSSVMSRTIFTLTKGRT